MLCAKHRDTVSLAHRQNKPRHTQLASLSTDLWHAADRVRLIQGMLHARWVGVAASALCMVPPAGARQVQPECSRRQHVDSCKESPSMRAQSSLRNLRLQHRAGDGQGRSRPGGQGKVPRHPDRSSTTTVALLLTQSVGRPCHPIRPIGELPSNLFSHVLRPSATTAARLIFHSPNGCNVGRHLKRQRPPEISSILASPQPSHLISGGRSADSPSS